MSRPARRAGSLSHREAAHRRPQRTPGVPPRPRHVALGTRDRPRRGRRDPGRLPRRGRDARRHRGVLRRRRGRGDPRRAAGRRRPARGARHRRQGRAAAAPTARPRGRRVPRAAARPISTASLRRLGVDHLDLWQVHVPDPSVADRGDAVGARHRRRVGQGPLRRGLELLRLAHGAGGDDAATPSRASRRSCRTRCATRCSTAASSARSCRRARPSASACCRTRRSAAAR